MHQNSRTANGLTATLFSLKDLKIPNVKVEEHSYEERAAPPESVWLYIRRG